MDRVPSAGSSPIFEALTRRITAVREHIEGCCGSERAPDVRLIAVSKNASAEHVRLAHLAGLRSFGENRVQELLTKQDALQDLDLDWHFIGRLQRNKVRQVVGRVSLIHSMDRLELLQEIGRITRLKGLVQDGLIQVNLGREESKGGFLVEEVEDALENLLMDRNLRGIRLRGFMTIAPLEATVERIREIFRDLKTLRDRWKRFAKEGFEPQELSMGMSSDYEVALQEGASMIRIGTAIFGERSPAPA